MTRPRPALAPAAALLAALIATQAPITPAAAQSDAATETQAPAAEAKADAPSYSADDVVATVGETEIQLDELVAVYSGLPENVRALPEETLWTGIVSQLIDETVISTAALEQGLDNRRDVTIAINAQRRAILANAYLEIALSEKLTDEILEAEYRKRYVDVESVKQVRASHILLADEDTAKGVLAEIRGGKDFTEAAKEHSTGPTGPSGGDLGYFEKEQMVPEFADAAFAMEAGEISEPVKSDFGWHLINVVEIRDRPAPDFDSVRPTLSEELTVQIAQEIIGELRDGAEITRLMEVAPEGALSDASLINSEMEETAAAEPQEAEGDAPIAQEPAPITENAPESAPAPSPAPSAQ